MRNKTVGSPDTARIPRRQFLAGGAAAATALAAGAVPGAAAARAAQPANGGAFQLKYAPHFGMFRHHAGNDHLDQLRFMHDEGFRALEDNGMGGREPALQEKIAAEMDRLGMEMGVFVAHTSWGGVSFASSDSSAREAIEEDMRKAVEVGKRVNATWCTVVPGQLDPGLEWEYQTANVVENLKRAAAILEPAGVVAVLEPLNHWTNHPGVFLTGIPQAYQICKAVGSPSVKILDDIYHQQITEGNLIPNLDRAWDEIAYIQVGDNPGRKEPTTGEINYLNVFRHLKSKGFDGIVGMEHGNSKPGREGERAVIDAYRECDA
ncbi:MAG: TIM barrel protein [Acidobacteriota bacterium]|nr:TIM barrel protein [Acidobacteriota bacterium]